MLDPNKLQNEIEKCIDDILIKALANAVYNTYGHKGKNEKEKRDKFIEDLKESLTKPLAESLAASIDSYIHNISIQGQIITVGNRFTQMAYIAPSPPITAGKSPNTLGIV